MGFFDKVRTFVGDHGCKVQITSLERQDPSHVAFPLTDSVFKGQFTVTASKPCTVLAHKAEVLVLKKHPDGREETVVLGEDVHNAEHQVIGLGYEFPYEMTAGQSREDGFCAIQIDIPAALRRLGDARPQDVSFSVRVTADVKGTPMDAEAKVPFTVVS